MADKDTDPAAPSLDERLKKARIKQGGDRADETGPSPMGRALRIGLELVVGVVIGMVIGRFIDDWLDTRPVAMILFLLLGFVAGVRNVMREAKRMQDEAMAEDATDFNEHQDRPDV